MLNKVDVIVGVPICKRASYVLGKFLANQQEIQRAYPGCMLVFATNEPEFIAELREQISYYNLNSKVISYETIKPAYARSRIWNIACGRDALRKYTLISGAQYLLFFDSDMTFDPNVINIMKIQIHNHDVIHSAYLLRYFGVAATGLGCSMITRKTLEQVRFRCIEFNNGQFIDEGNLFEMDLFSLRKRVRRGFFMQISHFETEDMERTIYRKPMGLIKRLANLLLIRYLLTKASILIKHDIPGKLQTIVYRSK